VPALRLSPLYLALATFALAVVTPSLIKRPAELTGGVQGISLVPPDPPQFATDVYGFVTSTRMTSDQWIYYITVVYALILFWLAWNLVRHRAGRAMRAIRDGEVAASASGINIAGYKTLAFGISALYAGIAGSLFGLATSFVSPDTFPVSLSIQLLVGAVVGGLASIPGPLLGGIFAYFLPIESNQLVPTLTWIPSQIASTVVKAGPAVSYGAVLILIMIFAPNGIVGLVTAGYTRLRRRLRGSGDRGTGQMPPEAQTV
jgi:branched-chain amino acid transport system permease protein